MTESDSDSTRRARQLEQLDDLERRAQELIDSPHYLMHGGEPIRDPATGEPLRDEEPLLRGLDVALKASDLRARMLGLYAPQRHHLVDEHGNTLDITRLMPLLARFGITSEDGG